MSEKAKQPNPQKEIKLDKKREKKHVSIEKKIDRENAAYEKKTNTLKTKYSSKIDSAKTIEKKNHLEGQKNDALRKLDSKHSRKVEKLKRSDIILRDRYQAYVHPNDLQKDMMRYHRNSLGHSLCFLAIAVGALGFCFTYSHLSVCDFSTGVDIIFNIIFMLVTFLTAEKVKVYNVKSSFAAMILGVLEILHFVWYTIPTYSNTAVQMPAWVFIATLVCYIIGGISLLFVGVTNYYRGTILKKYLKEQAATDYSAALELKGGK